MTITAQSLVNRRAALSLEDYARQHLHIRLRPYQLEAAQAVLASIRAGAGRSIVVLFARQSGKDELSAVLKCYLLWRMHLRERGIVEVNPTYKPQTINAMARFERRLRDGRDTRGAWHKRSDFIRSLGQSQVTFLSGDAAANVVGAVASLLLIVNEAQDVSPRCTTATLRRWPRSHMPPSSFSHRLDQPHAAGTRAARGAPGRAAGRHPARVHV